MLRHRDFIPKVHQAPSFGIFGHVSEGSSETLNDAVEAAGTWIKDYRVHVVNVETVILVGADRSSQTLGVAVSARQIEGLFWIQFVRVWYDDEVERPPYR